MPAQSRSVPASCHLLVSLGALALLQACTSQPQVSASREASRYREHARQAYTPPGSPEDPWGPYIREASAKFDLPEGWIRAVMHQESGGNLYLHGELITSGAGAMGLMQVMPDTYDDLRSRYADLGSDPFDPHDNIMAGSAYLREMYDIYGSPGFLAAYNAGPGRLDDYLTRNRPLPAETRRYVAAISPRLGGGVPQHGSPGAQYAMNRLPAAIPAGPRYQDPDVAFVPPPGYAPPSRLGVQYAMGDAPAAIPAGPRYQDPDVAFVPPPGYVPPAHAEPVAATLAEPPSASAVDASPPEPPAAPPAPPMAVPLPPPLPVARPSYTPPPRALVQVAALPDEMLAETPRRAAIQQAPLPEPPPEPRQAPPAPREAPIRLASRELRPALPVPPAMPAHMPFQMAANSQPLLPGSHGFHLIAPAMAEPVGGRRGGPATGNWAIQVGAFASSNLAAAATAAAREEAHTDLAHARGNVTPVHQGRATLYRARLQGLSRDGAAQACERLARQRTNCMVVSPDAQS